MVAPGLKDCARPIRPFVKKTYVGVLAGEGANGNAPAGGARAQCSYVYLIIVILSG